MFYRRWVRRDTEMGAWKRPWTLLRLWCPVYISPNGLFDTLFVRHADKVEHWRILRRLITRSEYIWRMDVFNFLGLKRPYDRLFCVYDAADWSQELDFKDRHR